MSKLVGKKATFLVKNFRFFEEEVVPWVDQKGKREIEYDYRLETPKMTPINPTEGLLDINFRLQILPDLGEIKFDGECIVESSHIKHLVFILKKDAPNKVKLKNKPFIDALNNLVLKICLEHAKTIGEKSRIRFPSYDKLLKGLGLEKKPIHVVGKKGILSKLPKGKIKNISKLDKFEFNNEHIYPGPNAGKQIKGANFDANIKLFVPKLINKISRKIEFHFHLKISPEIGVIYFDGQCILESENQNQISDIMEKAPTIFKNVVYPFLLKECVPHAEKIAKPYRIGFSAATVLKNLGVK